MITLSLLRGNEDNPNPDLYPDMIAIDYSHCTYQRPEPERDAIVFKTPDKTLGGQKLDRGLSYIATSYTVTLSANSSTRLAFDFLYNVGYIAGRELILRHSNGSYFDDWYHVILTQVDTSSQNPVFTFRIVNDFNATVFPTSDNGLYFNLAVETLLDGNSFDLVTRDFEYMAIAAGERVLYGFYDCEIRIDIYKGMQAASFSELPSRTGDLLLSITGDSQQEVWNGIGVADGVATWLVWSSALVSSCNFDKQPIAIGSIDMLNLNGTGATSINTSDSYSQSRMTTTLNIGTVDSSVVSSDTANNLMLGRGYKYAILQKNYELYRGTIPASIEDVASRNSDLLGVIENSETGEATQSGDAGWVAITTLDGTPILMCSYSQGTFDLDSGSVVLGANLTINNLSISIAEPIDTDTVVSYLVSTAL